MYYIIKYMNILLREIFAGIFVYIVYWNRRYDFLECSDKPSKFNSFAFTLSTVLYLACHWWYKLFVHWWIKGIYFASFYFRVWDLTREIRENKNPAKISTYTVTHLFPIPPLYISLDVKIILCCVVLANLTSYHLHIVGLHF